MTATVEQYLAWLKAQVGYDEGPNNANKYAPIINVPNNQPWCAELLLAGARTVGVPIPGDVLGNTWTPTLYDSFHLIDRTGKTPQIGAFAFYSFKGGSAPSQIDHVEFVVSFTKTSMVTIGGNVENAVREQTRSLVDNVIGFAYPEYGTSPTKAATTLPTWYTRQLQLLNPLMKGADVTAVQKILNKKINAVLAPDGELGALTDAAVKKFQSRSKLEIDGVVGPITATALGAAV